MILDVENKIATEAPLEVSEYVYYRGVDGRYYAKRINPPTFWHIMSEENFYFEKLNEQNYQQMFDDALSGDK